MPPSMAAAMRYCLVDFSEAFAAIPDRQIGQIDVDRQTRQIAVEQVDRRAALEREHLFFRNMREQAHEQRDLAS